MNRTEFSQLQKKYIDGFGWTFPEYQIYCEIKSQLPIYIILSKVHLSSLVITLLLNHHPARIIS